MVERILEQIKNNRVTAVVIVIGIIVIALATFSDNLQKLWASIHSYITVDICAGKPPSQIAINKPRDGDHVESKIDVIGTSMIHESCQYIFVIVRSKSTLVWKITDLVLVNTDGQWAGQARLDEIPLNTEATIEVRLTNKPTIYNVNQCFTTPPENGGRSNIVRVKRVK